MYQRPTSLETQEDLVRLQEEFNRDKSENKIKTAATVVSDKREEKGTNQEDACAVDIQDQLANTFESIPDHSNLGNIVEKTGPPRPQFQLNFSKERGFPSAKRRDGCVNEGRGSIFSRQFKKLRVTSDSNVEGPSSESRKIRGPNQSFIITGNDKNTIHEENMQTISSMSEQEILEERERLLSTMDPAIVAYLRSVRSKERVAGSQKQTIQSQNEVAQNMEIEELETTNEVLMQPHSDTWLNFSRMEVGKLAWMQDVELPKIDMGKSFEARFDFEGWLLPFAEKEITEKSRVLYHHGEEPGRPGYTLQELFQLSRSEVIQQKIAALNTIGNILSLQSTGVYDDVVEIPIEQVFFVVRFCLDDNTPAVLNAAIKAMRNLVYSKIDETCLDCLLGFGLGQIQPILAVDNESEDDNTVNDQQLAERNVVKCLVRTGILIRLRYVINTVKPPLETIVYALDILTRIARDSQFILNQLKECEGLVSAIVNNFVPLVMNPSANSSPPYGLPIVEALKFLRVLASRSKQIAEDLVKNHQLMDRLAVYVSSQNYSGNTNGLKLQTESLHLWSILLHFDLALDYVQVLSPVIVELFNYHYNNTNVDMNATYVRQAHASALLVLISACARHSFVTSYIAILQSCVVKWLRQFMDISRFDCSKLQIVASSFCCLYSLQTRGKLPENINNIVIELLNSQGFKTVTETVKNGSMLLNNYETHKASLNMRSVEAAAWHASEHVVPLLQTNSPLPFLSAISGFVESSRNDHVKLAFLRHDNITSYIDALRKCEKYHLSNNWFTRIEGNLLVNILKSSIEVRSSLDTCPFYEVAVKCLSIFWADQKPDIEYILANIILSPGFYPNHVLMGNLSIEQRHRCIETSLDNLTDILTVYTQVLGLKNDVPRFNDTVCLDLAKSNVIPIDWIYTPIIVLYSNQQHNKQNMAEDQQVFIIRNCLRWILIYETYFPDLAAAINPTDRFCRVACVFLGSDSLFLLDEIHNLLQLCLDNILKCETAIDFGKEIQGLNSFQDFFTQLLEQYQGVSYGDVLFGNFLLVPLAQRHSTNWRKILWSEYLGVVETFNVTPEQSVCALDTFLTPTEEDVSLLKCYRRAIVSNSVRKHSILYHIAKYHVEQFVLSRKNKA